MSDKIHKTFYHPYSAFRLQSAQTSLTRWWSECVHLSTIWPLTRSPKCYSWKANPRMFKVKMLRKRRILDQRNDLKLIRIGLTVRSFRVQDSENPDFCILWILKPSCNVELAEAADTLTDWTQLRFPLLFAISSLSSFTNGFLGC